MEKFIKEFYPEILEDYDRYCKREILPHIGQEVVDLNKNGKWNKETLIIIDINNEIMELKSKRHGVFITKTKDWWRYIKIVTE